MKILHTADWHIGQFKGPVVDGVNLRSQDTVKCLEYMVQVAIEEKPDIVCVSGDIFHQEQVGPVRYSDEMITATNIITSLAHFSKYVIVMRGTPNHDGAAQFRVLERMLLNIRNVDVVTEPGVIKTPWADIACLPGFDKQEFRAKFPGLSADEENLAWTKYISDMVFALRAECEKTPILMAHYTVPGCNMESGQTSFFTNFEPVIPREALMAARYEAVLLGHIHRPQIIEGLDKVFYSGAINAMNFNDEGQDRGFWIHEFNEKGTLVKGYKCTTPYRQFHTITWDPDETGDYIREGAMYLHRTGISEDVTDKIVRVRYSCTSEQKKALNIPLLQKNLYELGAFYVADIEAESTIDITNRGLLSEESDPRLNLKKWLEEKTFKNPDKIVELAEPIIAEAMKQSTTAEIHGVFKPVSISVRNYRNYKEESFDFSDISFCTINGVNGAGKSSLFMDAIVDCLFEETREGDCKAWIRGTEDARSGSIEFIFDIGEKRFRVVRTRTKSGKPTLNLSQYQEESADWMNLSKERIVDTQAEIEKLLGMDSMTFRSCALIMQDQYGLFLQAKKDERIAILGNLLGLGIYGVMELDARKKLADSRKELASKKEAVRIKTDFIKAQGKPEEELETVEKDIFKKQEELENLDASRRNLIECQEKISEAERESEKTRNDLKECSEEYSAMANDLDHSKQTLTACNNLLELADTIREKAKQHSELSLQLSEAEKDVIKYKNAKRTLDSYNEDIDRYQRIITKSKLRNEQIDSQISLLSSSVPTDLEYRLEELNRRKEELDSQQEKRYRASVADHELQQIRSSYSKQISDAENKRDYHQTRLREIKQQEEFMKNSGCPDIENASCRFLAKAVDDVKNLPVERGCLQKFKGVLKMVDLKDYQKIMENIGIRQMIFQGPPGTSKTFESKKFVLSQLNPSASSLTKAFTSQEDISNDLDQYKLTDADYANPTSSTKFTTGGWDLVQFHPSYGYEDFIRGIEVKIPAGQTTPSYESVNRILGKIAEFSKAAADNAAGGPQPKFYLVVDEINRANLATVFGELIYGLEYRNSKVSTPYEVKNNVTGDITKDIVLGKNLFILGTMNTADKSIDAIDYAIRRRFIFIDSPANRDIVMKCYQNVSGNTDENSIELLLFDAVQRIFDDSRFFNNEYQKSDVRIGHTYFLRDRKRGYEDAIIEHFIFQVIPILREYVKDGILDVTENLVPLEHVVSEIHSAGSGEEQIELLSENIMLYVKEFGNLTKSNATIDNEYIGKFLDDLRKEFGY